MGSVYQLTLRQLSGRARLLIMTVLAALPVILTLLTVMDDTAGSVGDFELAILGTVLSGSIAPLVVLAIAAAAFANELEDRTLANLALAPIQRWQIVLPKLLGAVTVAAPFIALSALVVSYVAYMGDAKAMIAVVTASVAGVALYASAFVWLGLVTTQAIGVGLLYIVLWEGFFSGFVSGVRLFSIRHYTMALMHAMDERRFAEMTHLSPTAAVIASLIVFGGFLFLAIRRLRRMDIP
jgi:ABC-type transport system involved in multi-copper enzyme maturation permease subunit